MFGMGYINATDIKMSIDLILNLLNVLNKDILCKPLVGKILFYSTESINVVINLHEFNNLFITFILIQVFLHYIVISILLNGLITLL